MRPPPGVARLPHDTRARARPPHPSPRSRAPAPAPRRTPLLRPARPPEGPIARPPALPRRGREAHPLGRARDSAVRRVHHDPGAVAHPAPAYPSGPSGRRAVRVRPGPDHDPRLRALGSRSAGPPPGRARRAAGSVPSWGSPAVVPRLRGTGCRVSARVPRRRPPGRPRPLGPTRRAAPSPGGRPAGGTGPTPTGSPPAVPAPPPHRVDPHRDSRTTVPCPASAASRGSAHSARVSRVRVRGARPARVGSPSGHGHPRPLPLP